MITIAGLDLGPNLTGYCVGRGDTEPEAGAWLFPDFGARYGEMGYFLTKQLTALHNRTRFGMIMVESPILVVRSKANTGDATFRPTDSLHKLRMLYGLGVVLETWCWARQIPCREASSRALKKEITGDPFADKAAMVKAAERDGIVLPKHDTEGRKDAADAYAAWRHGLRLWGDKEMARHWDFRAAIEQGLLT